MPGLPCVNDTITNNGGGGGKLKKVEMLREVRGNLEPRVRKMARENNVPSPDTLLAEAPEFYKTRRFWRYFSPKRRRKMVWGEVRKRRGDDGGGGGGG